MRVLAISGFFLARSPIACPRLLDERRALKVGGLFPTANGIFLTRFPGESVAPASGRAT